jgi:hypothetical protein
VTTQADYTPEEWTVLLALPFVAGLDVSDAQPGGSSREALAISSVSIDPQFTEGPPELVRSLLQADPQEAIRVIESQQDTAGKARRDHTLMLARDAAAILRQKATPEELASYQHLIHSGMQRVAEASKSGAFLGMGGTVVTEAEQAAIQQIDAALKAVPTQE